MYKALSFFVKKIIGWCCFFGFVLGCSEGGVTPMLRPLPDKTVEKVVQKASNIEEFFMPRVDILFIIDNSGSMKSHQANLKNNVKLFISGLQSAILDYRIGVTTTDRDDRGTLKGFSGSYIDKSTPNGLNELEQAMLVGIDGDGTEVVFPQIVPVLENTEVEFHRDEAYVAVIFVTDAEDQSLLTASETYIELVSVLGGNLEKLLAYGAIIPPGESGNGCARDGVEDPLRIIEFINLVHNGKGEGKYFNLCSTDFGLNLANVAKDIVEKVGKRVFLNRVPDPKKIQVKYGGVSIPNHFKKGWAYDPKSKSIYFGREMELPKGVDAEGNLTINFERAIFPEEREHAKK